MPILFGCVIYFVRRLINQMDELTKLVGSNNVKIALISQDVEEIKDVRKKLLNEVRDDIGRVNHEVLSIKEDLKTIKRREDMLWREMKKNGAN